MYNGLINVYKEPGFTSMDAVAVLRGILKQKKIGHTGTLDPAAEGVLMVCLGNATKLCSFLEDKDKEYECRMLLGVTTDTEDTTGTEITRKSVSLNPEDSADCLLSEEQIKETFLLFKGDIKQIPPMYSALKKDGKKLYELARAGKEIEREARDITIHDIEIIKIDLPYVTFRVHCSKGTYRVSFFSKENSLRLSEIEELAKAGEVDRFILPTSDVFSDLSSLFVKEESSKIIENGNSLLWSNIEKIADDNMAQKDNVELKSKVGNSQMFKVYTAANKFIAVYKYDEAEDIFKCEKMFL